MEDFCVHGNQSLDPIRPKTLCSLSPTPVMLHIKFDQDWPTGFRDTQKCGRRTTTTTVDRPLVYYKLTVWPFGSGELKTRASACKTLCPQHSLAPKYGQSKKISSDQELIQSDPTSCPQNQKGNNWIPNWQQFTKSMRGKPNEHLFPKQVVIQLPKNY